MIGIKNHEVLISLGVKWHPKLRDLFEWLCGYKEHVVITCGYEARDKPSVHSVLPLRGLDIRSWIYRDPQGLCDIINKRWTYDPARPHLGCAKYHDSGRGYHIHLQVTDDTEKN